MLKVVNLHKEKYDVYIGRAGRGHDGYFGNPIAIGRTCSECGEKHTRGGTLVCYEGWLWKRIKEDSEFKKRVMQLRGKTLGCFCKPKACHGDILAKAVTLLNAEITYEK